MARIGRPKGAGVIPLAERFWYHVVVAPSGCWEWTAYRMANGYGRVTTTPGTVRLAHRVAWELTRGPLAKRDVVCHHCDNPACVNPSHLFVGTQRDNLDDMQRKGRRYRPSARTHCLRGHAFTDGNTIHITKKDGSTQRMCRTCRRAQTSAYDVARGHTKPQEAAA